MAYIRSRKHPKSTPSPLNPSLIALAVLATPLAGHAQQTTKQGEALPEIKVQSAAEEAYKADWVSSPKVTQPLVDTPQTISVIKKEVIQEQGATTLTEALRNSPGVGTFSLGENGATNTGDAIYMRGFDTSSSIFVDNVRDLGSVTRDMFNIDQVEVFKGPAGTDNGRGAPTGSINLVTKQPTLKEAYSGSIGVGSGDYKRVTADLNKPLNMEGGAALRLNLLKEDSGVAGRDVVKNDRQGVAAALGFNLKGDTRTYINFLHIDQKNKPENGVPTVGLPGYGSPDPARPFLTGARQLDPSKFYGTNGDFDNVTADMFTVRIEHDITPDMQLLNTTRYGKTSQNYLITGHMASAANLLTPDPADPSTWLLAGRSSQMKDQSNEILTNQTNLTAKFKTGGIKHSLVAGIELTQEKQSTIGYRATSLGTLPPVSLYNPDPNVYRVGYNPTRNNADTQGQTDTASAYLFDTLEFNPQWQLSGGIRVDHYRTKYSGALETTSRNAATYGVPVGTVVNLDPQNVSGTLFNWKLGLLYKPTETSSIYISHATAKQPPGGATFELNSTTSSANNVNYDPQGTKTTEIGAKWDLLDNRLALTAALYRTDVTNEVVQDSVGNYSQTGQKRVQGIELGVVGAITPNWQISAGYTTMDTKITSGPAVTSDGSDGLPYTPRQAFTSWTTYKMPGGLTIGGGARYVGELHRQSDAAVGTPNTVDSYWVFDAMAAYTISKNVDLQLNVYNLTDKDYAASMMKAGYRYTPGIPRSVRLTANVKF